MEGLKNLQRHHKIKLRWNFFAAMHGKSIVDGIGAAVKRFVRSKILAFPDQTVKSAEDFVKVASEMPTVKVFHMTTSDLHRKNSLIGLEAIIKSAKPILDIKKNHCFEIQTLTVRKKLVEKVVSYKLSCDALV